MCLRQEPLGAGGANGIFHTAEFPKPQRSGEKEYQKDILKPDCNGMTGLGSPGTKEASH